MTSAVTVRQLNLYIKNVLEGDNRLAHITVVGEISNFKCHFASGHMYFTLKDDAAAIKCVMFKGNASRLQFVPQEGMRVMCTGRVSVFERDGVYQLYAENMLPDGEGNLLASLEKLKEKLSGEGLFDRSKKRAIPKFPKNVAVITSETGAAVKDIFSVLGRRYPLSKVIFIPAIVQGALAPNSLCDALNKANDTNADVIIIGRGGGSVEDLWCFNDEKLVRCVAASKIPVISAVGHETDFTLCDFAADLRAPTPSAAAELAVPDIEELTENIEDFISNLKKQITSKLVMMENSLNRLISASVYHSPHQNICDKRMLMLDLQIDKLFSFAEKKVITKEKEFCAAASRLEALSPIKTMLRGFSVAEKRGEIVTSVQKLSPDDEITLRFCDGRAKCSISDVIKE